MAVVQQNGPCAFLDKLAVRKDERRRGLGQALLVDAFAMARAHGCGRCELATDTRTGALEVYLRVGMRVKSTWAFLGVELLL